MFSVNRSFKGVLKEG